ncbi:MAG: methyltransferase domain-containing protein [Myxococcota bacterium]|jgi:SAM-dependent methyltransferase|nr:methyltransferase domain-containing protein [Myxococcota bacterium]
MLYDELAAHPDPARRVGWRARGDQMLRFSVCCAAVPLSQVESVLDVGCGLGDFSAYLRKRGCTASYLGIDSSPQMITAATARHPGERFACADAEDLGELGRFDLVVACGTFSLRHPQHAQHFQHATAACWAACRKAFVLLVPSERARRHRAAAASPDDEFAYFSMPSLYRSLTALGGYLTVREDFLPTDVCAYLYRDCSPAHQQLREEAVLSEVELAALYLERDLPALALDLLDEQPEDDNAQLQLRRGQALKALNRRKEAREALERALSLDAGMLEARLEREDLG